MSESHWVTWHREYEDPDSRLNRRVGHVQRLLRDALDAAPPGPIRLLSLCAGEGRDVFGVLPDHPRSGDVTARLVELDPILAGRARAAAPSNVEVLEADAGSTACAAGIAPVDVLLLCGIFGNVPTEDIAHTVRSAASLCRPGATVIWTRYRGTPDVTPRLRQWFVEAGWDEVEFVDDPSAVGANRLRPGAPVTETDHLFTFGPSRPVVVDDALLRRLGASLDRFTRRRLQTFAGPIEFAEFADGEVLAPWSTATPELDFVNRVVGLRPEHAVVVPDLVEHYRRRGVRPWFEIAPFDGVSALFDALHAAGARAIDGHGLFVGRPGPIEPPAPPHGVTVTDATDAARYGALMAEGFEIAEGPSRQTAAVGFGSWLREDGWRAYEAAVDGVPVAGALLAVDDHIGYLASAATIPAGRRRGVQTALVRARMADAMGAGCELVAALATPNSTSAKNMQRAGLHPAATLSTWRLGELGPRSG